MKRFPFNVCHRAVVLFLLWTGAVSGQIYLSAPDTALFVLDTLVVTAGRYEQPVQNIPYAISIVEPDELRRIKKGLSLEEALRTIPGVQVNNRYNLSQGDRIAIRGLGSRASFGVRGIKVVLDGIPLTMPDGQTQLNNIDLASIGRIEIMRGPSSSLYGNASGGVIVIDSRMPPEKFQVSQQLSMGSDVYRKSTTGMAGTVRKTSYSLNYTALHSDGFREHSQSQNYIANFIAKHRLGKTVELSAVFSYFDAPYMLNASSLTKQDAMSQPRMTRTFVKQQGSGKQVEQMQGGITLKMRQSHIGTLQTTVYGVSRSLDNAIPGRVIDLQRLAGGIRTTWSRDISLFSLNSTLLVGSDIERQQDARIEYENNGIQSDYENLKPSDIQGNIAKGEKLVHQDETVLNTSGFAEVVVRPLPAWSITGGVRMDRYDFEATDKLPSDGLSMSGERRMQQSSPMIGLSYRYSPHVNLYSHYSTAFQTPTTTELSNRADGAGGFNPQLGPEKIKNLEVGFKGLSPSRRVQFSMAAYHMKITDMLIPFQINTQASEEIYFRNAGEARNNGFETAVNFYPLNWFFASLAYTFSDFTFADYRVETSDAGGQGTDQLNGNSVPGVPRHAVNLGFYVRRPSGFSIGLNLSASDAFYANDFNGPFDPGESDDTFINDAYVVADLSLDYTLQILQHQFNLYANVDNLFNVRHNRSIVPNAFGERFFEPAAGRSYFAGIAVNLKTE